MGPDPAADPARKQAVIYARVSSKEQERAITHGKDRHHQDRAGLARQVQQRKLPLSSDPHTYGKPGKYRIIVEVIDIFGNDTSQAFDVEVK